MLNKEKYEEYVKDFTKQGRYVVSNMLAHKHIICGKSKETGSLFLYRFCYKGTFEFVVVMPDGTTKYDGVPDKVEK